MTYSLHKIAARQNEFWRIQRKIGSPQQHLSQKRKQTRMNRQNASYARRKALSLEVNADILVNVFNVSAEGVKQFKSLETDWRFPHIFLQ